MRRRRRRRRPVPAGRGPQRFPSPAGKPEPVVVFGAGAATVAVAGVAADLFSGRDPGTGTHLGVGAGAVVAAGFAVPGRHLLNVATFGLAAVLVLWRVVDVEYRGAE